MFTDRYIYTTDNSGYNIYYYLLYWLLSSGDRVYFSNVLGTSGIFTIGKTQWKIDAFEAFEKSSLNLADMVIGNTVIHKSQTVWFVEGVKLHK